MTEVTNAIILEEIQRNRVEIKNSIEASETRLLLEIATLNNKINILESENSQLKQKVEELQQLNRQNNIVIFGLEKSSEELNPKNICEEIKNLVSVEVLESEINNCYHLGKSNRAPIKVEFTTFLKKKAVLSNSKKLKGTSVFITPDLTQEQRSDKQILRIHLNTARINKNKVSYIKGNKLYVNKEVYTPDELRDLEKNEGSIFKQKEDSNILTTTQLPSGKSVQEEHTTLKSTLDPQIEEHKLASHSSTSGNRKKASKPTSLVQEKLNTRSANK